MTWTITLTIGLGLLLAAFSVHKILGLERGMTESRAALQQLSARLVAAHGGSQWASVSTRVATKNATET